ncbi:MAG TPA: energy transducer TonB [Puia sp.]|jgi:hypothetical protein
MTIKIGVVTVALIYSFISKPAPKSFELVSNERLTATIPHILQDTLPALHTIKGDDIDLITPSPEDQTIAVKMKNGIVYTYHRDDWDYEDYSPSINQRLKKAIAGIKRTYTKVEHAPEFPGGGKAWDKYMKDFCDKYRKEIRKKGPAEITLQFIVHVKGQITDVQVISNPNQSKLEDYAIQAIQDGPAWIPGTQNGRKVICYCIQRVKLSL